MGSKKNSATNLNYLTEDQSSSTKVENLPPLADTTLADAALTSLTLMSSSEKLDWFDEKIGTLSGKGRSPSSGSSADMFLNAASAKTSLAVDIATAVKYLGPLPCMKQYKVLSRIMENLSITTLINNTTKANGDDKSDLDANGDSILNNMLLNKNVNAIPASAAEGTLTLVRALAEVNLSSTCAATNRIMEVYLSPLIPHLLTFLSSSNTNVRTLASDAVITIINRLNPASGGLILPFVENKMSSFFVLLRHPDWRVKLGVLDAIRQFSVAFKECIPLHIPVLIPNLTGVVWDTKPQVSRGAGMAIRSVCECNINVDIKQSIAAVVLSIVKPSETVKAVEALCHTTFIVPVDAGTLSILCPVLSRCLLEKKTLNKRMACIVIDNMSKLVESPYAVRPFGRLLVPGLKDVCDNVQFEDIRDTALSALGSLTKALGHASIEEATEAYALEIQLEVAAEEKRIKDERGKDEIERARKEEEDKRDRAQFKEAMDAERRLQNLKLEEEKKANFEKSKAQDAQRKSVKKAGVCQGCGLKKCKKTCLFYEKK